MSALKPQKRAPELQPISREHHQALLLCWKIKTGFAEGIGADRIKTYTDWFYSTHIVPHFKLEEEYLFPVLGNNHQLVMRALDEHRLLAKLFAETINIEQSLMQIQEELEKHIRFEERVLFNEVQTAASPEQLRQLSEVLADTPFVDNTSDVFWV